MSKTSRVRLVSERYSVDTTQDRSRKIDARRELKIPHFILVSPKKSREKELLKKKKKQSLLTFFTRQHKRYPTVESTNQNLRVIRRVQ